MVAVISLSGYVASVWGENGSEGDGDGDCKKGAFGGSKIRVADP